MGKSLKEITYLDLVGLARLARNSRDRLIVRILVEGSCKVTELVNLKVKDISSEGISFGSRRVLVSAGLIDEKLMGKINDKIDEAKKNNDENSLKYWEKIKNDFNNNAKVENYLGQQVLLVPASASIAYTIIW